MRHHVSLVLVVTGLVAALLWGVLWGISFYRPLTFTSSAAEGCTSLLLAQGRVCYLTIALAPRAYPPIAHWSIAANVPTDGRALVVNVRTTAEPTTSASQPADTYDRVFSMRLTSSWAKPEFGNVSDKATFSFSPCWVYEMVIVGLTALAFRRYRQDRRAMAQGRMRGKKGKN